MGKKILKKGERTVKRGGRVGATSNMERDL